MSCEVKSCCDRQRLAANKRQDLLCYEEGCGEWLKTDDLLQELRRCCRNYRQSAKRPAASYTPIRHQGPIVPPCPEPSVLTSLMAPIRETQCVKVRGIAGQRLHESEKQLFAFQTRGTGYILCLYQLLRGCVLRCCATTVMMQAGAGILPAAPLTPQRPFSHTPHERFVDLSISPRELLLFFYVTTHAMTCAVASRPPWRQNAVLTTQGSNLPLACLKVRPSPRST